MLELEALRIAAGSFRLQADFALRDRAQVAVVGPSGAGKSTLVNAVAGFVPPDAGRILWNGRDLTRAAPGQRPIAMLFQDGNLFPHLTLAQNVGLGLHPGLRLSRQDRAGVEQALDRVGLAGLGARRPAELSGGQQSRAALARVLVQARPLMVLDEPFAALGPALKADMLDLVAELARETAASLLMVTHDPGDARRVADEVIVVADGHAAPPAPTQALLDHPPAALRAYLGNG
ncbi:MAG: ATP-binding cassette domain-containing protein [Marinibacterium sp.]|nr:ATP-binding cassette domain-containing protein [Marinibacterium sp.]